MKTLYQAFLHAFLYHVFLPLPPLLLHFLLLLQFLRDPGLPHGLLLGPLVRTQVQRCLQCGGPPGTVEDLISELLLKVKQPQGSQLYHGFAAHFIREGAWDGLELLDAISYAGVQPGMC